MTEQEVREALARAEAATPGPWRSWDVSVYDAADEALLTVRHHLPSAGFDWADAIFIAAARQDVPALCRLALDLLEGRRFWQQDSGYDDGMMAERRRVRGYVEDLLRRACDSERPACREILEFVGPAPDSLPALPPDRTREMLARAVELLEWWWSRTGRPPGGGPLYDATWEFLKEVNP